MTRLKQQNQLVDLQILDNEASEEYTETMQYIWKVDYQLLPTNPHHRNATKRAIHMFKAHLLSILAGISEDSPKNSVGCSDSPNGNDAQSITTINFETCYFGMGKDQWDN